MTLAGIFGRLAAAILFVVMLFVGSYIAAGPGIGPPIRDYRQSDDDQVKSTVSGFYKAVADGRRDAACKLLTDSAVQELSSAAFFARAPASCAEAIETFNRQLSSDDKTSLKSAQVSRVTVTGDKATVADNDIVLTPGGLVGLFRNIDPRPMVLVVEEVARGCIQPCIPNEAWMISSLG